MIYRLISWCLNVCVHIFYRVRYVGEAIPSKGSSIIVANHPNGLLDPLVVLTLTNRPIRFLAKEPLFRMPGIGYLLRFAQALPVYRRQDGYTGSDNASMFSTIEDALQEDCCVCLFPEGISHNEPQLQPLKTGAARLALGAESLGNFTLNVHIVPVGLFFVDKGRFRSEVVVVVGTPIILGSSWKKHYQDNAFNAARTLTDEMSTSIREVTVNLESWSDLPLLNFVNQFYQGSTLSDRDPIERLSIIADTYDSFIRIAPHEIEQLRQRILRFKRVLARLGISPNALDLSPSRLETFWFVFRQIFAFVIGFPIACLGFLLFCIPYQAVDYLAKIKGEELDIIATIKVLSGIIFYPIWLSSITLLVWYYFGFSLGLTVLALILLIALYTLVFIEKRSEAFMQAKIMLNTLSLRSSHSLLRSERQAICESIDQLLETHYS
jgi:glycerol-3-phosphate O-acyltransferase / dihydroxyacetone phosphate acyltransferase